MRTTRSEGDAVHCTKYHLISDRGASTSMTLSMILKLSVEVYLDVIHHSEYLLLVSTTNVPDNGVELCLADG